MKKKKMIKMDVAQSKKSNAEISEVYALMDVMKAIKIKESRVEEKNVPSKKRLIKKTKIDS